MRKVWGEMGEGELRKDLKSRVNYDFAPIKDHQHKWREITNRMDERLGRVRIKCDDKKCKEKIRVLGK